MGKRNTRNARKTIKRPITNNSKSHIVMTFIQILNVVKLYHWRTKSFAQHKATDDLYSKLNEHIDLFVEILMGKDASRIRMVEKRIRLIDAKNTDEIKDRMHEYRAFLIDITKYFTNRDTDLLNVRDEILGDVNQFLYLLTLT